MSPGQIVSDMNFQEPETIVINLITLLILTVACPSAWLLNSTVR